MDDRVIVLGGGPSAAITAKRLVSESKSVLLISESLGGTMNCMGSKKLQSYASELDIKHPEICINDYLTNNSLTLTANSYMDYISDCIKSFKIKLVYGYVSFIEEKQNFYTCHVEVSDNRMQFNTSSLIIATGIAPKALDSVVKL